jgi:alcohol dehydrogenase class IV
MVKNFSIAPIPEISVNTDIQTKIPELVLRFGKKVLLVAGNSSFLNNSFSETLFTSFGHLKIQMQQVRIVQEPSPADIDHAVDVAVEFGPDVVVGIGGGSVIDAGKAIAAMIPLHEGVKNYLEDVGTKKHPGTTLPFIAVPTTSGTGSEATKNAVISEIGEKGFKKSLRHNNFIPKYAVIDSRLLTGCPDDITAFSGMDAFTQLLESYLSVKSNAFTDMLALEGIKKIRDNLYSAVKDPENLEARTGMAIAAFYSGITLANAGLGVIHGFAQPLGSFFKIPHGIVCGTLMGICNKITLTRCISENNFEALSKYAKAGKLFSKKENETDRYYAGVLIDSIDKYITDLKIPKLAEFGVLKKHIDKIVVNTGNKNNPVSLNRDDLIKILEARI